MALLGSPAVDATVCGSPAVGLRGSTEEEEVVVLGLLLPSAAQAHDPTCRSADHLSVRPCRSCQGPHAALSPR